MDRRERAVRLWFSMWLEKRDLGIRDLFADDASYVESWGPEYHGAEKIRHWFEEWNTRGAVEQWDIRQFFHRDNQTVVVWYFRCRMHDGEEQGFDGVALIAWTPEGRISFLQEFGCKEKRYDPYQAGDTPRFRDETAPWL